MSDVELVLLNIDIRNKLRLGNNFEIVIDVDDNPWVRSTFKNWRLWRAERTIKGFDFTEIKLRHLK